VARHLAATRGRARCPVWPRLRLPWSVRSFFSRSPTREQALLDSLAREGDPLVASWARAHRDEVRDSEDLLRALEHLQTKDDPVARSLAATIWLAWRNFSPRDAR
jgi:hypothetical protein